MPETTILIPSFIGRIESLREKQSYPAFREKRARYSDLLYTAPSKGHVCGFR